VAVLSRVFDFVDLHFILFLSSSSQRGAGKVFTPFVCLFMTRITQKVMGGFMADATGKKRW